MDRSNSYCSSPFSRMFSDSAYIAAPPAVYLISITCSFLLLACFLFGGLTRSSRSLGVDPGHLPVDGQEP
jgi:hypothetical protein